MGCYRLWIGAESGSQRILDAMERRTNAARMRDMIRLVKSHGIRAGTFIMVGYEGETWNDIKLTADHLRDAAPDDVLTTLSYPIKGTPYYNSVADRIVARRGWEEGSDRDLTIRGRNSRRFYAHAQRWLQAEAELGTYRPGEDAQAGEGSCAPRRHPPSAASACMSRATRSSMADATRHAARAAAFDEAAATYNSDFAETTAGMWLRESVGRGSPRS